jgi:aminodeoxyfutalosine deaminase
MTWREQAKIEIHCHLLGIIEPPLLAHIRANGGTILVDPDALQAVYPVTNRARFERWLQILKPYQAQCFELMRPILAAHIRRLVDQNVVYTEIMLSPSIFPQVRQQMLTALHQWHEWTLEMEQGKVQVEYLMVIPRSLAPTILERDAQTILDLHRANLIVGVALVGMETGESLQRFSRCFARWRDAGVGIEIHAGEHSGPESVDDALKYGRPHRIGHCLSAFHDPALVESIRNARVHIEFCPTSNLRTGAVTHLEQHPIQQARQLSLSFGINTDNPGAFGCSMASEHQLVANTFGFSVSEFRAIFCNSLAARFQPKLRYISGDNDGGVPWL